MEIEWFKNRNKILCPVINGHLFTKNANRNEDEVSWRCSKYRGKENVRCAATVNTIDNRIISGRFQIQDHICDLKRQRTELLVKRSKIEIDKKLVYYLF